jgi:hypothetical protein
VATSLKERVKFHLIGGNEKHQENIPHFCWYLWRYSGHVPPHDKSTALAIHQIVPCQTC